MSDCVWGNEWWRWVSAGIGIDKADVLINPKRPIINDREENL